MRANTLCNLRDEPLPLIISFISNIQFPNRPIPGHRFSRSLSKCKPQNGDVKITQKTSLHRQHFLKSEFLNDSAPPPSLGNESIALRPNVICRMAGGIREKFSRRKNYFFSFRFVANAFLIRVMRSGFRGGKPSSNRLALTSSAWLNFVKVTIEAGNFPFSM